MRPPQATEHPCHQSRTWPEGLSSGACRGRPARHVDFGPPASGAVRESIPAAVNPPLEEFVVAATGNTMQPKLGAETTLRGRYYHPRFQGRKGGLRRAECPPVDTPGTGVSHCPGTSDCTRGEGLGAMQPAGDGAQPRGEPLDARPDRSAGASQPGGLSKTFLQDVVFIRKASPFQVQRPGETGHVIKGNT